MAGSKYTLELAAKLNQASLDAVIKGIADRKVPMVVTVKIDTTPGSSAGDVPQIIKDSIAKIEASASKIIGINASQWEDLATGIKTTTAYTIEYMDKENNLRKENFRWANDQWNKTISFQENRLANEKQEQRELKEKKRLEDINLKIEAQKLDYMNKQVETAKRLQASMKPLTGSADKTAAETEASDILSMDAKDPKNFDKMAEAGDRLQLAYKKAVVESSRLVALAREEKSEDEKRFSLKQKILLAETKLSFLKSSSKRSLAETLASEIKSDIASGADPKDIEAKMTRFKKMYAEAEKESRRQIQAARDLKVIEDKRFSEKQKLLLLETRIGQLKDSAKKTDANTLAAEIKRDIAANADPKDIQAKMTTLRQKYSEALVESRKITNEENKRARELERSLKAMDSIKQKAREFLAAAGAGKYSGGKELDMSKGLAQNILAETDPDKVKAFYNQLKENNKTLQTSQRNIFDIRQEIGNVIKRFAEWTVVTLTMHQAMAMVNQSIQYLIQLDSEMNKIRLVTGQSSEDTQRLAISYNKMAKELGVSTLEVAKGSLEWIRQGKTVAETNQLLTTSTMMSKLANLDAAQSTEYLTSILAAYNLEAKDSISIVDKLTAVDNSSATSVG